MSATSAGLLRGGHISTFGLVLTVFAVCDPVGHADDGKTFIDWKNVPQSQAPDRLAEVVCELEPALVRQPIVLLPLEAQAARAPGGWNLEGYLMEVLRGLLVAGNMTLVDVAPCADRIRDIKGPYDKLAPKLVIDLAKASQAGIVLAPAVVRGERPALQFVAYDGRNGRPKQMLTVTFKPADLDYLACTPRTNRAFIQWCENNFDKQIDRGECWDVPAKGIPAIGSSWGPDPFDFGRPLHADETPFPGDPLATKDRRHTMVTYRFTGDGTMTILHQNWHWGKESGRKIGWGAGKLEGHDFWRPRPMPGDACGDVLRAAKARPKQLRGVKKSRTLRGTEDPPRDGNAEQPVTAATAG